MDTEFVKELSKCKIRSHAKYNIPAFKWSKVKVREWLTFIGWNMCLNAWLSSPENDRNMFKSRRDGTENNMASNANLNQKQKREYLEREPVV